MSDLREAAAELLEQIPPGEALGTRLFNAIARLTPTIAVEAVALRWRGSRIEVFMTQRSSHEAYPNQWHAPGSISRNGEEPKHVFARLERREFQVPVASFRQVGDIWHQEERSWMHGLIYLVVLTQEPPVGHWWDVEELPENIVSHHRETVIPKAVKAFRSAA